MDIEDTNGVLILQRLVKITEHDLESVRSCTREDQNLPLDRTLGSNFCELCFFSLASRRWLAVVAAAYRWGCRHKVAQHMQHRIAKEQGRRVHIELHQLVVRYKEFMPCLSQILFTIALVRIHQCLRKRNNI